MTDIVERISQLPELANLPGGALAADCFEAAIEIKKLRAENEKLRAALSRAAKELEFVKVKSLYRFAAEAARDAAAALEGLDDE